MTSRSAAQFASVAQFEGDAATVGSYGRCHGLEVDRDAQAVERAYEHLARTGVELPFHQVTHAMNDLNAEAAGGQPPGGLQAQQPAAEHQRRPRGHGDGENASAVIDGSEHRHALRQPVRAGQTRQWRHDRPAAGRQHQVVVLDDLAGRRRYPSCVPVDPGDSDACSYIERVRRRLGDPNAVFRHLSGQQTGEQDAVVRPMRLRPEDGDFRRVAASAQLRGEARAGHAVSNDDRTHPLHLLYFGRAHLELRHP